MGPSPFHREVTTNPSVQDYLAYSLKAPGMDAMTASTMGLKAAELKQAQDARLAERQMAIEAEAKRERERAQDRLDQIKFAASMRPEPLVSVLDKEGKPVMLPRSQATGMTPVNAQTMGGGKPPADYTKKADALLNVNDALTNYTNKLDSFKPADMLSPTKRATMGTAYQNALLQAKEMYNLGVLNGPDERILKSIIDNPMDWKTAMTPTSALREQASELQGVIQRNAARLSQVYGQPMLDFAPRSSGGNAAPANNDPLGIRQQ
jgi:hypothetical protein